MMHPAAQPLRNAARPAVRWLTRLARWGFVANAVVYSLVGGFALQRGLGAGGRITDADGALRTVRTHSMGAPLLAALAVGFFSYALWRFVGALFDADHDGRETKGLLLRSAAVGKGMAYAGLGARAIALAQGAASRPGAPNAVTASFAGEPGLVVIALCALAFGAYECYRGYAAKLSESLRLGGVDSTVRRWIIAVSRAGIAARGAVIILLGIGLLRTAAAGAASRPISAAQLLFRALQRQQHTDVIFASIGVGLLAYAAYLLVLARYREVRAPA